MKRNSKDIGRYKHEHSASAYPFENTKQMGWGYYPPGSRQGSGLNGSGYYDSVTARWINTQPARMDPDKIAPIETHVKEDQSRQDESAKILQGAQIAHLADQRSTLLHRSMKKKQRRMPRGSKKKILKVHRKISKDELDQM